jgi:hypothetical protein
MQSARKQADAGVTQRVVRQINAPERVCEAKEYGVW